MFELLRGLLSRAFDAQTACGPFADASTVLNGSPRPASTTDAMLAERIDDRLEELEDYTKVMCAILEQLRPLAALRGRSPARQRLTPHLTLALGFLGAYCRAQ
jgi:hypothetical protein